MTFEQAFLKIKEKFDNADASNTDDFALQITFTDEDCGGTFYAEVKEGKLAVEPYNYYDNNAMLHITKSALLAYLSGRASLDKAIANGDAYVEGDASKIADLKATIKKISEKKTVAKKATAKKAAKKATPNKTAAKKAAKAPAPAKAATTAAVKAETTKTAAPAKTDIKSAAVKSEPAKNTTAKK